MTQSDPFLYTRECTHCRTSKHSCKLTLAYTCMHTLKHTHTPPQQTASMPEDSRVVQHLLTAPVQDGGARGDRSAYMNTLKSTDTLANFRYYYYHETESLGLICASCKVDGITNFHKPKIQSVGNNFSQTQKSCHSLPLSPSACAGQYTMFSNIVRKYGLVPKVCPATGHIDMYFLCNRFSCKYCACKLYVDTGRQVSLHGWWPHIVAILTHALPRSGCLPRDVPHEEQQGYEGV